MKSFTGKFTSVGGWALLLALLLGAGLMISACGDEEVPTPTTPAPTPAPAPTPTPTPPPDPEPTGPAIPSNLRVSAATSDSITWTWDAVEGVLGYQGQFSTDTTFTDADPTFLIVAPSTSHTVQNLSGNMTGHFRVRSGTGTSLTDLSFSDWTDGAAGTTSAPPAAVALDAPDNLESSDPENDSIVLDWDEVDDADHYEVEQRADGGTWEDANCGDDSNEVDGTECIAGGLAEGTDYDFRVRGIPADDDDANATGDWAETDGTTTGRAAVATSGGTGDLNLTWKTDGNMIVWSWEPMSGVSYEWKVLETYSDAADPCGGTTFDEDTTTGAQFEHMAQAAAGEIRGLCLRTDDKDNRALSFAWGVGQPGAATATQSEATVKDNVVTALTWTELEITAPFEYEIRVAADPQRDPDLVPGDNSAAAMKAVQAACTAGAFVDQGDADITFTLDEITVSTGLKRYTGYLLCARLANTAGATGWAVPATKLFTHPGQPPRPSVDRARSDDTSFVWNVAVRSRNDVPRGSTGYDAKTIHYDVTFDDPLDTTPPFRQLSTATPGVKDCEEAEPPVGKGVWKTDVAIGGISTDGDGVVVKSGDFTANRGEDADTKGLDQRVYVCVRAKDGDRLGPWNISSASTVKGVAGS